MTETIKLILTYIYCALFAAWTLVAMYLALRYNLHMLQLNGYKNKEHIKRMAPELKRQWLLFVLILLGLLRVFMLVIPLEIIIWLFLGLTVMQYNFWRKHNTKKKLVFTSRLKRILATDVILSALIVGLPTALVDFQFLYPMLLLAAGLQFMLPVLANFINKPMEWCVNRHFINDAKRKLKSVPGLKVIGITGSFGKTSVKFYLKTLLQDYYNVLATPESYNTPMGIVKTIRGELKPTHEIFICEMGARHVGDIKEDTDIVTPDWGIITSVGPQHLETFHSIDNIKKTKFELADALPSDGLLFLNGDNEYIRDQAKNYKNIVYYRSAPEAEETKSEGQTINGGYYATDIKPSRNGTEFTVHAPNGESEVFSMRLLGEANIVNVVGAIACANTFGVELKKLVVPVRRIKPAPHRLEIKESGDVSIIDDAYNSNPVGSKIAVEALRDFDGLRILVTPGMVELGDKEKEYNRLFGTYAADCCDYIFLIGREHSAPIREGVLSKGFPENRCITCDKLEEAMKQAYAIKDKRHKYILLENDLPDNYR